MSHICKQCKNRLTTQGLCNNCRKRKNPEASSSQSREEEEDEENQFHQIPAFDLFVRAVVDQMKEIDGVTPKEANDIASKNWEEFGYQWCYDSLKLSVLRRYPHLSIPNVEEIKITAPEETYPKSPQSTAFNCFLREEMNRMGMGDENSGVTFTDTYGRALKKWFKFGFQWCVDSLIATSVVDTNALMASPLYQFRGYFEH